MASAFSSAQCVFFKRTKFFQPLLLLLPIPIIQAQLQLYMVIFILCRFLRVKVFLFSTKALPILVTGTSEPISVAIIRSLQSRFTDASTSMKPSSLRDAKSVLAEASAATRDRFAFELLEETGTSTETSLLCLTSPSSTA